MMTRSEIAEQANEQSEGRGPTLTEDSTRETLCAWLQWCDPNGSHTDRAVSQEQDMDPYTLETAWEAVADMVEANK